MKRLTIETFLVVVFLSTHMNSKAATDTLLNKTINNAETAAKRYRKCFNKVDTAEKKVRKTIVTLEKNESGGDVRSASCISFILSSFKALLHDIASGVELVRDGLKRYRKGEKENQQLKHGLALLAAAEFYLSCLSTTSLSFVNSMLAMRKSGFKPYKANEIAKTIRALSDSLGQEDKFFARHGALGDVSKTFLEHIKIWLSENVTKDATLKKTVDNLRRGKRDVNGNIAETNTVNTSYMMDYLDNIGDMLEKFIDAVISYCEKGYQRNENQADITFSQLLSKANDSTDELAKSNMDQRTLLLRSSEMKRVADRARSGNVDRELSGLSGDKNSVSEYEHNQDISDKRKKQDDEDRYDAEARKKRRVSTTGKGSYEYN